MSSKAEKKKDKETAEQKYGKNLCKYAYSGNVKRMQRCVRKGGKVNFKHPLTGGTPLHRAVLGGRMEACEYLVAERASVNAMDGEEWRPLHFAASKGFTRLVRWLLDKGADVNAQDISGNSALHVAARKGNAGAVCVLVEAGADASLLNVHEKSAEEVAASAQVVDALHGRIQLASEEEAAAQRLQLQQSGGDSSEDDGIAAQALLLDEQVVADRLAYGIEFSESEEH